MKTATFNDNLLHLEEFFELCRALGLNAEAEAGRFGVYRSRIGELNGEMDRLRAGEAGMPIYKKALFLELKVVPQQDSIKASFNCVLKEK